MARGALRATARLGGSGLSHFRDAGIGNADDKYVYRLRMMSGALSKAMAQGCWCDLQGAYFANWDASRMVAPYAAVGERWWDTHFISLDYGFGKSSASAHLHVRIQDGRLRTIGEFVAAHLPAYGHIQNASVYID
jgi:hypothetical protein